MDLVIYTAATDLSGGFVTSKTDLTAVTDLGTLVFGDSEPLTLKFTTAADGTAPAWLGDNTYSVNVSLGLRGSTGENLFAATNDFTFDTDTYSGHLQLSSADLASWVNARRAGLGYLSLAVSVTTPSNGTETYAEALILVQGAIPAVGSLPDTPVAYATYADALAAQTAAEASATSAGNSSSAATNAKNAAQAAQTAAESAETNAAADRVLAQTAATTATTKAAEASASASDADADRIAAQSAKTDAEAAAAAAAASAASITGDEASAAASAAAALASEQAAAASEAAAAASESAAALSESNAAASESAAAASATTALNAIAQAFQGGIAGNAVPATSTLAGDYYRITSAGTSQSKTWAIGDAAIYEGTSGNWTQLSGYFPGSLLPSTNREHISPTGKATKVIPENVLCWGDSLTDSTFPTKLGTHLSGQATVTNMGIGGETSTEIKKRAVGAALAYPVRGTDTITAGTVTIRANEAAPPRLVNASYSAYWDTYRARIATPESIEVFNLGRKIGTMQQRQFLARVGYATDINALNLYEAGAREEMIATPTNETALMEHLTTSRGTLTQSSEQAQTGTYSAKFVCTADSGNHEIRIRNGASNLSATKIYELDVWVYLPSGQTINSIQIGASGFVSLGTRTTASTSAKDQWVRLNSIFTGVADNIRISCDVNTGDISGENWYVDNASLKELWVPSTHALANATLVHVEDSDTGTVSSGFATGRNYYVVNTATNTIELATTSGGAPVDAVENGLFLVNADYRLDWTATTPDATSYDITLKTHSAQHEKIYCIWAGANNMTAVDTVTADIAETVGTIKSGRGRFLVLTVIRGTASRRGTANYDAVEEINAWIKAEYPDNYVDVLADLIADGGTGTGQDLIDTTDGIVPDSLRADAIHLNSAGDQIVADSVYAKMQALEWYS